MMIKVLYTPTEHAYFFQSMIQPQDNFRVFVCNNYDQEYRGVAEPGFAGGHEPPRSSNAASPSISTTAFTTG